jgi:putative N-acetylmannosamine-6-phosphate epimerase
MRPSRGMGAINPDKMPAAKKKSRRDDTDFTAFKEGGKVKSKVNEAGNYTKPSLRKRIFNSVKAAAIVGTGAGKWSARKAQVMAKRYKAAGGGYK